MGRMSSSFDALHDFLESVSPQNGDTRLADSLLLGFDTETTGASVGRDSIVSASLVLRVPQTDRREDHAASWVINPHRPISPAASRVNGFTDAFLTANGVEPKDALHEISGIIATAQSKSIPLLAYNASFDVGMIESNLRQWGLPGTDISLIIDPLVIDRAVSTRRGRRTLSATTEYYGIEPDGDFHDAHADTVAAVDLIAPISELHPQIADMRLSEAMEWQRQAYMRWAHSFNKWLQSQGRQPIDETWL